MKKTFKSKVDLLLLIPALFVLIGTGTFMVLKKILIGEIAVALLAALLVYIYINTLYELTGDNKLKIKSGVFFHREIYIKSIKKVKPTKDHTASPALSFDRLEIRYNRYGRVIVSPERPTEFIRELKEVNPRIQIEERR
jgi:Bacterial PH domain